MKNPDYHLACLRELIRQCTSENPLDEIYVADKSHDVIAEFVQGVTELDQWLSAGGLAPSAWRSTEVSG
ncbi:hypothetical protein ACIA8C_26970 [Nocardia sp. NPDC051321]|uniref:hypothetical protein n=1 Tax=Nocardia sp. NPDC051321 TaxID=3364323 RepID=UPI0037B55DF6